MPELNQMTVDAKDLAKLLMLTPQRVGQLADKSVMPRGKDGKFPLVDSVQKYLRFKLHDDSISAAKLRIANAEARMAERKDQREEGELLPAAWIQEWMDGFAIATRERIWREHRLSEDIRRAVLNDLADGVGDWVEQRLKEEGTTDKNHEDIQRPDHETETPA